MGRCFFLLLFILQSFILKSQSTSNDSSFRIVGYYSLNNAMKNNIRYFPFNKLTHINLYFLNPDTSGNFKHPLTRLVPFINAAHKNKVKVLLSIGGGGSHPYYKKLLNDTNRDAFVIKLNKLINRYNLDGIDIDLEDKDITGNYGKFVVQLGDSLHHHFKIITAAVAIYFKDSYPDEALSKFDFINLMSYDHTAAWAPEKPGPHASYLQAVYDLAYFRFIKQIPKNKITLGVPFYGYGFGPALIKRGITLNYATIVQKYPGAAFKDTVTTNKRNTIYYNGIPTIKMKTQLALKQASGIMIWQLSGDAPPPNSLLDAINMEIEMNKDLKSQ